MSVFKLFFKCIFAPKLYRIHSTSTNEAKQYSPLFLERFGDRIITSFTVAAYITLYTSPFIAIYVVRKGLLTSTSAFSAAQLALGASAIYYSAYVIRALGRSANPDFTQFVHSLPKSTAVATREVKKTVSKYDFEFHAWPVDFDVAHLESRSKKRVKWRHSNKRLSAKDYVASIPGNIVGYFVANSFGIRMMYPGMVQLLQTAMWRFLVEGRAKLVEHHKGERFKIKTDDRNNIEVIFVDNRNTPHKNGRTLVICSEGNAGFYEVGIISSPLENGYSVLGWNHPGFGGSTGTPFPEQEYEAIDAIMQFATQQLRFLPQDIILFGWSIGGFTTSIAASLYPEVKGVILDASFDDVLPLAVSRMPASLGSVVRTTIKEFLNLNNVAFLLKYHGPVRIIRRTQDEVIVTEDQNLLSNRGNDLVMKILKFRYPNVFNAESEKLVWQYLAADRSKESGAVMDYTVDENLCSGMFASYVTARDQSNFPLFIGDEWNQETKNQVALYLIQQHLNDFFTTHCAPLPANYFVMPWNVFEETFVKI